MADFIPTGGQEQVQPAPDQFIPPAQAQQMAQTASRATPEPQAPAGSPTGAGLHATQENPLEAPEEQANPDEQEEYNDLFIRAMAMVNDNKVPPKKKRSLAQEVVKMLSTKGKEAYVSVGTTAGLLMTQLVDTAKRAKKEYSGPVIQEVGMDLVAELVDIGRESGAIKDAPEEGTPEYDKLLEMASLEAAKFYGEYQIKTGQADQQGHRQEIDEQMQREADSGALDNWGMEEMNPEMRNALAQQVGGQRRGP